MAAEAAIDMALVVATSDRLARHAWAAGRLVGALARPLVAPGGP